MTIERFIEMLTMWMGPDTASQMLGDAKAVQATLEDAGQSDDAEEFIRILAQIEEKAGL